MCGCFRVNPGSPELAAYIDELAPDSPPIKTGDIFPGEMALNLCLRDGSMAPEAIVWGFPRWDGRGLVFNARAETAPQKPMFSRALRERRCIVPASGFYEWRKNPERKKKDKFFFQAGGLLFIAAIWSVFTGEHGLQKHFTLLTTQANASMLPYHHRMPLLLAPDECLPWLCGDMTGRILNQTPGPLEAKQIS